MPTLYRPKCKVMTKQWQPLTDSQWAAISPFFDGTAALLKRKRKHDLRQIIDIILWLLRTGCQWRNLPPCWPPWQAVYYYFDVWKQNGTFERINAALNESDRKRVGKMPTPSLACIDSQSVKLGPMICEERGLDPNKRVNGGVNDNLWLIRRGACGWSMCIRPIRRTGPLAVH